MTKPKRFGKKSRQLAILLLLVALLVPSGGRLVDASSNDLYQSAFAPANATPVPQQDVQTATDSVDIPETPEPTQAAFLLPVNDFSPGSTPKPECYSQDGYSDDTITVRLWRETINGSVYNCCDVVISDASQLRAALGGTVSHASSVRFSKLSARNHPVVAINGDYYDSRKGSYAVRQSQLLQDTNTSPLDLLIIDYQGNMHIYSAQEKVQAVQDMAANTYQAISFGPALVVDGIMQIPPSDYLFDPLNVNPRAAIGQLGELHYLLVVVDGRTSYSEGIDITTLAAFMTSKGCIQAYALDGGASASLYFHDEIYNHGTDSGERSMYDILYFASAAQ